MLGIELDTSSLPLPQTVVSLLLHGSGAVGCLKYYEYVEQDKNYLKFYCNLESKYYQFAK